MFCLHCVDLWNAGLYRVAETVRDTENPVMQITSGISSRNLAKNEKIKVHYTRSKTWHGMKVRQIGNMNKIFSKPLHCVKDSPVSRDCFRTKEGGDLFVSYTI